MKISTTDLYKELEEITNQNIDWVESLALSFEELNKKPSPDKWSIAECLQHLVCYGNFYLPAMEESLVRHDNKSSAKTVFKAGFFGNKFANMLRYKEKNMKKFKAPNIKVLSFLEVDSNIINLFIDQQKQHLSIIEKAKQIDLTKVKVPIALTNLIKTSIGDTLRFTIYHNERHIIQAKKVL